MSRISNQQVDFGGNFNSLKNYAEKVVVKSIPFVETQTYVLAGVNYILLDATVLPGNIALGTTTTRNGGIVSASLAGAVGTAATTSIADSMGNITNLVKIRDAVTNDSIMYLNREVYGLIQAASTVVDGDAIGAVASENLQMSFVYLSSAGVLTLTPVTATIEFQVNKAYLNQNLPTYEFQGGNVNPDIVGGSTLVTKIATYSVTNAFLANEIITLTTGNGVTAGTSTVGGDYANVALGANASAMNTNNDIAIYLNGVKQKKADDFVWDSNTTGHFSISLDNTDYFEVYYKA